MGDRETVSVAVVVRTRVVVVVVMYACGGGDLPPDPHVYFPWFAPKVATTMFLPGITIM